MQLHANACLGSEQLVALIPALTPPVEWAVDGRYALALRGIPGRSGPVSCMAM